MRRWRSARASEVIETIIEVDTTVDGLDKPSHGRLDAPAMREHSSKVIERGIIEVDMKMSGAGTTIERHGMSRALDSTPTAEMRKQLGALAGDALPTQPGTEPAFLLDLSEKLNRWIEDYRHREQKPASSSWFQLFVDIDQDRDGLITYDELVSTIRRKLKQPKSVLSDTVIQAL